MNRSDDEPVESPGSLLQDSHDLERSSVVANAAMNRDRGIAGVNSYERDLGFSLLEFLSERQTKGQVAWLDLCCGTGKALIETAGWLQTQTPNQPGRIVGVDLVPMFRSIPPELKGLELHAASLHDWQPREEFDLITCVHGLHYIGDKLEVVRRMVSWLKPTGLFLANLDLANICIARPQPRGMTLTRQFQLAGLVCHRRQHVLQCEGRRTIQFPYEYLGADDQAGPNYSQQPAVNSHYRAR